ncbi:MAG: glycosyltransferase [Candidatus Bathyarchaeum sp.]|nr:MAG: glycosyltransferase [Candidatus Bathyarchaeum sp.]
MEADVTDINMLAMSPVLKIIWINKLESHKVPSDFISVAKLLPNHNFWMCGSGSLRDYVMEESKGVNNLRYLGIISDKLKTQLLNECDIYISTSTYEGFGFGPLEALRQHKIILLRDIPAFKEIYGEVALFASSVEEFVEHIRSLENRKEREKMEQRIVEKSKTMLKKYSIENAVRNIILDCGIKSGAHILAVNDDTPYLYLGGHRLFYQLINRLGKFFNVTLITSRGKCLRLVDPNINTIIISRSRYTMRNLLDFLLVNLNYLQTFLTANKEKRADFVFTNDRFCSFIAYFAKKILKMKTLTSIWDDAFFRIPVLEVRSLRAFGRQILYLHPLIHLFERYVYRTIPVKTISKFSLSLLRKHNVVATSIWKAQEQIDS